MLVVLHSDGYVEAFADHVAVLIVQRLHARNAEEGRLADEHLDETLPRRFRDLYWPNKQQAGRVVECRTIEQEITRLADLTTLRELREFANTRKDAKK